MTQLKRRNLKLLILGAVVLLVLLATLLFLVGSTMYESRCACLGEWSGGICRTDDWAYDIPLPAPSPICHLYGIHSEKWICIGSWERQPAYSGFGTINYDTCHGWGIDLKQCYGIPYSAPSDDKGGPISCNYPCDDKQILEACKTQDVIKFDRVTVSCAQLENWCK